MADTLQGGLAGGLGGLARQWLPTSRRCGDSIMPLPNTSPLMSPMPTAVKSCVWVSRPSSRKWRFTASHAPRAVMPMALWSYPTDPPEANASPSQKP